MASGPAVVVRAYAKVNLDLRILGERPDGYHEVRTILQTLRLHDTLTFAVARGPFAITCDDPEIPTGPSNLIWRAATLMARLRDGRARPPSGVRVRLVKRIPAQAGLGGGSADAAATLTALARLWKVDADLSCLARLASELGADVPFFLGTASAYGQGRGERLESLQLDVPWWIVVATPDVHVSTAWAYEHSAIPPHKGGPTLRESVTAHMGDPKRYLTLVRNDFEPLVLRTYPAIAAAKQSLYLGGAEFAQLSGSGSSVYGLFREEERARTALDALAGCRTSLTAPGFRPG